MSKARRYVANFDKVIEAAKVLTHEQIKLLYNHEIEEYQRMSTGNTLKHPGLDLENLIKNL